MFCTAFMPIKVKIAEIFDIPDLFLFLLLQGVDFLETK